MDVDLAVEAVYWKLLVLGAITVRGNIGGVIWDFLCRVARERAATRTCGIHM